MPVDFSQFRNINMSSLLHQAASLSSQLGLKKVEVPLFFTVVQQAYPLEMQEFLGRFGVDPNTFYSNLAGIVSDLERDASGNAQTLALSDALIDVLNLTLKLQERTSSGEHCRMAFFVALFTAQSPLRSLAQAFGITTQRLQALLNRTIVTQQGYPSLIENGPNPVSGHAAPVQQQPVAGLRPKSSTEATNCPTLSQFGVNWLERAREGSVEPAIGRDEEIERVLQILSRRTKNNPVLVGEPGTGKTAIVEGLAHRLLRGNVPADLAGLKLYQLDIGVIESLQNGEEVMRKLVEEVKNDPKVILFIDEVHTLISAHSQSNNAIANLLKPEMARGTIKILGATTLDEYTKHIERDKAFERRFQKVTVDEPDVETATTIIKGIKDRFEAHHHVTIPDNVVACAVKLSHRYISDRRLPDKAIDLIDEAASCMRIKGTGQTLAEKDIMEVITRWTGIPMQNMTEDDTERLRHIEEHLHESVIGQDKAIVAVANAIRRSRMGLNDAARPIGSFLFLGTTGVGKTELCKALAEFLFRSRDMIVRIDMSEYQQEYSVSRLFGAPPGYVGYDQGGQLTEAVRRKPYSLVLFDEIEKAHPKVFETLLQVLDDGRMTDGQGREVNFKNTIIVMTSNMGQDVIMRMLGGINPTDEQVVAASEAVVAQLRRRVAPEFINRIDNIVMFLPLTRDDIARIARLQLRNAVKRMGENGIRLSYTDRVVDYVVEHGYQPEYGGRPVKRVINASVVDAIGNALVNGTLRRQLPIECDVANGAVVFRNLP